MINRKKLQLENQLSDSELDHFIMDGYFIVKGAIDVKDLPSLERNIDLIDQSVRMVGYDDYRQRKIGKYNNLIYPNFIDKSISFINLLDNPIILPKIYGLLGWNIFCYYSDLVVTPVRALEQREPNKVEINDWHRDSGRVNSEVRNGMGFKQLMPILSLKVGYFISDCNEAGMGNLCVIPGSHISTGSVYNLSNMDTNLHTPVLCNRGDAIIFDRRLVHSRSENNSTMSRKVLFYGYSYRWLQGYIYDSYTINRRFHFLKLFEKVNAIQGQLLGFGLTADNAYYPDDKDVPLKGWLSKLSQTNDIVVKSVYE